MCVGVSGWRVYIGVGGQRVVSSGGTRISQTGGGGLDLGQRPIIWQHCFAEFCMKMKEIVPGTSLGSVNGHGINGGSARGVRMVGSRG